MRPRLWHLTRGDVMQPSMTETVVQRLEVGEARGCIGQGVLGVMGT